MRFRSFALLVALCFGSGNSVGRADEWSTFRGRNGDGISSAKNLPMEWAPSKNVVWKQPIAGLGWSSPVLDNGRLYLTTAIQSKDEPKDLSLRTLCLAADTGKTIWDVEVFRKTAAETPKIHGKNSHASPTPLVENGRIYVHFGHHGTACLDTNGKEVWKNSELTYAPVHGNGGTPILVDGLLVFSCDGNKEPFVVALDAATGKVKWKTLREIEYSKRFAFSTPAVITVNGKKQIVSPGAGSASAYDAQTGKEIWFVRYSGYSVIPQPVFGHGLVYLSTSYDSPVVMAIRPDGTGDVTDTHVAWTVKKGAPHTPSLLLIGDELYMVSDRGVATCVDAKTGTEIWQERIGGNFSASPIFADGKIYLQSEDGVTTVFAPGKTFNALAKNELGERTLASYCLSDGVLFIRTADHLYRIQKQ